MILDDGQRDLGPVESAHLLGSVVYSLDWQEQFDQAINARYAHTHDKSDSYASIGSPIK